MKERPEWEASQYSDGLLVPPQQKQLPRLDNASKMGAKGKDGPNGFWGWGRMLSLNSRGMNLEKTLPVRTFAGYMLLLFK